MTPLKIGVVSAIVAALAHNVVDSDLYYFGTGLALFMLFGVGLQLNADGVTPESIQKTPRWSALALSLLISIGLFYFGAVEVTKAHVRAHLSRREFEDARAGTQSLSSIASGDGEARYLAGLLSASPQERLQNFQAAAEAAPTTKYLRALAREQQAAGNTGAASASFAKALERDPNNLLALKALLELNISLKNEEEIERVAKRLVDVEKTTYFKTRALPELVPTETYFARKVLADHALTPKQKIELLEPAVEGLREYAVKTVPNVVRMAEAGLPEFAGESVQSAGEKLDLGTQTASSFLKAGQVVGDKTLIAKAGEALERIEQAKKTLEALQK
jgi:tetratricopeptide (TPR) repeat protein